VLYFATAPPARHTRAKGVMGSRVPTLSYPEHHLADAKVRLRPWLMADLDCIEQAATDSRIPAGTSVPAMFTREAGMAFIERQWSRLDDQVGVSLAVSELDSDRPVGLSIMSLRPQVGVGGLGYWIVPAARGRGYATSAARLLTEWSLRTLGLQRVEAWVEPANRPSRRVLLAAGFEQEGLLRHFLQVDGQPRDALVFSRVR
jgi:[ribosomal protein S5]-alanine N-acetyltransferase